jgi:hypothetical protein
MAMPKKPGQTCLAAGRLRRFFFIYRPPVKGNEELTFAADEALQSKTLPVDTITKPVETMIYMDRRERHEPQGSPGKIMTPNLRSCENFCEPCDTKKTT